MFLIFRQRNLTPKRYSESAMKREDWYFKNQKGQSNMKSQQNCDWFKTKSWPPSPVRRFPLNLGYWWNYDCALRQAFVINPFKAVKVCKGSTKARVKHMEGEYPYGGVDTFGNIQYNKKGLRWKCCSVAVLQYRKWETQKTAHKSMHAVTTCVKEKTNIQKKVQSFNGYPA